MAQSEIKGFLSQTRTETEKQAVNDLLKSIKSVLAKMDKDVNSAYAQAARSSDLGGKLAVIDRTQRRNR